MNIRRFRDSDIEAIEGLFFDTVHTVNLGDYTKAQVDAWAPEHLRPERRHNLGESLREHISYVAEIGSAIVGFGDLRQSGYLDRLFTHKDHQRQGIATALADVLEMEAKALDLTAVTTDASITARPFFEHRGYQLVRAQTIERFGVELQNFHMVKHLR